uniref:Uncharacterized protein n=1 Tax=Avena sativa TaxID=4498 RepID=A0ACD5VFI6_AVESA
MFLMVVGHNTRFRALQPIFKRSIEVISRYFKAVLYAVGELRGEMIRPPSSNIHPKIQENNFSFSRICILLMEYINMMAEIENEVPDVGATKKKIAAKGVKTDKGFKEIHIGQATKALTKLVGYDVTTTQVTNHLRKWKIRYQRIEKLRLLSGALWDDDQKMIVLEDQHYLGHTQDTPKDAEFLNTPLVNYEYMEACFANKLAIGKFAMESNEPLGKPIEVESIKKTY